MANISASATSSRQWRRDDLHADGHAGAAFFDDTGGALDDVTGPGVVALLVGAYPCCRHDPSRHPQQVIEHAIAGRSGETVAGTMRQRWQRVWGTDDRVIVAGIKRLQKLAAIA